VRVLVVDDDEALVSSLQRLLRKHGFEVEVATDGATALARLSKGGYDVMLLDLCMDHLDGMQVFEAAKADPGAPSTILFSGHLDIPTAVRATRSGVAEVLEKPVPDDVLVLRLRDAAAERRSRNESPSLPDLQRELILGAFESSGGNLSRAAKQLGIPRSTLRDRLRKYGVR